jgi:hypothetical protein
MVIINIKNIRDTIKVSYQVEQSYRRIDFDTEVSTFGFPFDGYMEVNPKDLTVKMEYKLMLLSGDENRSFRGYKIK